MVAERGILVSMPSRRISFYWSEKIRRFYLGLACTLLDITTLQHTVELKTSILIDRRECLDVQMRVAHSSRGARRR